MEDNDNVYHNMSCDLRRFGNILEFVTQGLNQTIRPRMAFLLLDIHGEVCWNCSKQSDVAGIHELTLDQFKDKFVLLENGVCPHCKNTMLDMIKMNLWTAPHVVCLAMGMRTAKQLMMCYDLLYREYQLLVLEKDGKRVSPSQYYGMNDLSLVCSCVADGSMRGDVANTLTLVRNDSSWFSDYFAIMDLQRVRFDAPLYDRTMYGVSYHNNVATKLESPTSIAQLRGVTRISAIVPESAWQMSKHSDEYIDMVPVFECLKTTTLTMRKAFNTAIKANGHAPVPHVLTVTTPRCIGDITTVLEEASWFDRSIYFARLPTWEVNPDLSRQALISEHSKQDLRDYACIPT